MYICWYMPIKSNQSWRDSDNFREQFFQSVDTAVGILSYLGTGGTAADFPLPATAFDSSFAASQSAFWFDCRNLEPTAWNPNKIWGLPLPRKKNGTIKVYILQSQTPTSTKWYSQLSHDPFTIQDAHAAGVLSWPSAWSPFFFTWESGNRACQIQKNKYIVFKTSSLPNGLAQPC